MKFSLKGGLGKLDEWVERAKRIHLGAVEDSAALIGEEAGAMAQEGQRDQVNPQGRKWRKTKDGQPLKWPAQATVALVLRGTRIVLEVRGKGGEQYVPAQHSGASHKRGDAKWKTPARRIVPGKSLPKRWRDRLVPTLRISWLEFLGGRITSVKKARRRKRR